MTSDALNWVLVACMLAWMWTLPGGLARAHWRTDLRAGARGLTWVESRKMDGSCPRLSWFVATDDGLLKSDEEPMGGCP